MRRLILGMGLMALAGTGAAAEANWSGKGEGGIVFSRGNADNDNANIRLELARELDRWKHGFGLSALRASNAGNISAERYGAGWQSDYKLTERSFWFGALRYEMDEFSGFDYQSSATTGYGRKLIDTESTKLTGQLGLGYRSIKNSLTAETLGDAVIRGDLNFERVLTETTSLINRFSVESGSNNTLAINELALQVRMSDAFALSFGVGVRHNTDPPTGLKNTDTLTTVNLVYAIK